MDDEKKAMMVKGGMVQLFVALQMLFTF